MHHAGFFHSWVKQRLPSLSSPHYKWKAKNGSVDRALKCYSSANHTFFQVWKIRPSFSKRLLQILIAWLLIVLVIYQKIIFQVSLEWLGFSRLSSVSLGSGPYTKTRNIDVHRCKDSKCEKYFSVIFLAIFFKPLKVFCFHLVTGLWLVSLSAFLWFFRSFISNLLRIFWCETPFSWILKFSFMLFNNMKRFSQHLYTCSHNQWLHSLVRFFSTVLWIDYLVL